MNFIKRILNKTVSAIIKTVGRIKSGRRTALVSVYSFVCVTCIILSFVFTGARIVYKVKYLGKDIAIVADKQAFDSARQIAITRVEGKNVEAAIPEPEYIIALAPSFAVNDEEEIVNAIIENTDEIVIGSSLTVEGEQLLYAETDMLYSCMETVKSKYDIKGGKCESYFEEHPVVGEGCHVLKDSIANESEIMAVLSRLTVVTEVEFTTDVTVPYSTVEVKSDNLMIGLRQKVSEGKNGVTRITRCNIYKNGVFDYEKSVEEEVRTPAEDEVVTVGTVIPDYSQYGVEYVGNGMVFPISSSRWSVSAYFGDGRGHKGIDISTYEGAPILAVQGGTVTLSEWYYGYGNCVIIDHGNGFTTLYGHASLLLVSVGQHVEAGDVIALVGSTGDSTGSHLHFEIAINGNRLDPAPILGLY